MASFFASIFASIAYVGAILLANLGLAPVPVPPNQTTEQVVIEEINEMEEVAEAKPDPVIEELRQLRQELADIKKENSQLAQVKSVKPPSVPAPTPTSQPKTFTTPSGAVINEYGNIISDPKNSVQPDNFSSTDDVFDPKTIFNKTKSSIVLIRETDYSNKVLGCGSGFIIDSDGNILTNAHVVEGRRFVTVLFYDGVTRNGEVVGRDENHDLAIVKIDGDSLPFIPLGDSDPNALPTASEVLAIGYPAVDFSWCSQDIEITAVDGIINARRVLSNGIEYLQTNALIQKGNSGGPLLNSKGEVIGINTKGKVIGGTELSSGVNFALPINFAKKLLLQLKTGTEIFSSYESRQLVEEDEKRRIQESKPLSIDKIAYMFGNDSKLYINVFTSKTINTQRSTVIIRSGTHVATDYKYVEEINYNHYRATFDNVDYSSIGSFVINFEDLTGNNTVKTTSDSLENSNSLIEYPIQYLE